MRRCSGLELKLVAVRPGSGAPACSLVQAARNRKPRQGCRRQREPAHGLCSVGAAVGGDPLIWRRAEL